MPLPNPINGLQNLHGYIWSGLFFFLFVLFCMHGGLGLIKVIKIGDGLR